MGSTILNLPAGSPVRLFRTPQLTRTLPKVKLHYENHLQQGRPGRRRMAKLELRAAARALPATQGVREDPSAWGETRR